jgi:hypothetical protein
MRTVLAAAEKASAQNLLGTLRPQLVSLFSGRLPGSVIVFFAVVLGRAARSPQKA